MSRNFSKSECSGNGPVIYMIGDSTVADKSLAGGNPERGWGQLLPEFFQENIRIVNRGRDGRSSKSFMDEGHWEAVIRDLREGDWLIVQFGHNDQKADQPRLYAAADTDYRKFLTRFAEEARAKGGHPLFVTSICRRRFNGRGRLEDTHGDYPDSMRSLAAELEVPLVDLNQMTREILSSLGVEKSKSLFLHFSPHELPFYPEGKKDDTHLSLAGARKIASLFAIDINRQKLRISEWLKDEAIPGKINTTLV